jgi:hypothetical protein
VSLPGLNVLDQYSASGFPPGYNPLSRTFYSPVDKVHEALRDVAASATVSLIVALYGFDDDELAQIIHDKIDVDGLFVQLSLDSSQAGGVHERAILAKQDYPATSIAIGRSEKGAIMHMKALIVDGLYLCDGSTNWSDSGETRQDNQLTIIQDPLACAKARARVDAIHDSMLMQMAARAKEGGTG